MILPGAVLALALPWLWMFDSLLQATILTAQLLLCACGIVSSYVTGLRPMRMVFFVFTLSWLGVGPLYQISHRALAWNDSGLLNDTDRVTAALALTLLATTSTALAMWLGGRRRARRADLPEPAPVRSVRPRSWTPWGYLGLLGVLTPYVVLTNGGVGTFFSSRADRVEDLTQAGVTLESSGGLQVAVASILPAALAVVAAHLFIWRIREARAAGGWMHASLSDAAGLVVSLGAVVLYANPISNTRFLSLAAFGSIALAMVRPRGRTAGRGLTLGLLVATLGIYPLSNALASDTGTQLGGSASPLTVFASKDFDGFQQVVNTFIYVEDHGYSLGSYISSALFFFVPRSLWTTKATPASIDVAENRDYWFTNLSLPVHAEFYLEFGIIGMLLLTFAMGLLWSRIDEAWLRHPGSMGAWLAPFLCLAQLGLIRGPLGSLSPIWLTVTVLLLVGVTRQAASVTGNRPDVMTQRDGSPGLASPVPVNSSAT
ncbi:hypothetical protein DMO24_02425 [Modestobacter versicolor]|uniref:O-antigen polysaccharide polymerase Wzy n=1 Tax=Modestobacter versicolor TaxID=429133 RepID=A0A323VE88_9ACTN|nr:hypothetical protein DMO24_02425 [Modestobacter versicolor]